ncbi:MAG: flavodoxin domain-containing protein [Dehalococcoidales bacterium]|nr:flavodoxin domain-containing protein [Dehalococcoidales bacterium]
MSKVLVLYHSLSGNTESMAKAVQEGAASAGAEAILKKANDAGADDLLNCDAVVMGTANYFSYEAGMMKDFFDRTFFTLKGKVDNKPYAAFGSYGGGGVVAIESLAKLCENLGLKKAADIVGAQREPSAEALEACKALGAKMALL